MRDKSLRSGERQVASTLEGIEAWHKWRYKETLNYIVGKTVFDVGCGTGYGSFIMGECAKEVIGLDDSEEAIKWAKEYFTRENTSYFCGDFLSFETNKRDVIIAFEIIEHIEDTKAVFEKFKSIGPELIILSTPYTTTPIGANKFHYRHFGMDEIVQRFLEIGYKIVRAELKWFGAGLNIFVVAERGI